MPYNVLVPSKEYQRFLLDRLATLGVLQGNFYAPRYPAKTYICITTHADNTIYIDWNNIDKDVELTDFMRIEEIIRKDLKYRNEVRQVNNAKIGYMDNGGIMVTLSITNDVYIPPDTLKRIYSSACERYLENENS